MGKLIINYYECAHAHNLDHLKYFLRLSSDHLNITIFVRFNKSSNFRNQFRIFFKIYHNLNDESHSIIRKPIRFRNQGR